MWISLWFACQPQSPELLVAPDASRDGAPGFAGPFGVLVDTTAAQARVVDRVVYDVLTPTVDGTTPADGPLPLIALVQGGLVTRERYQWLGAHAASRGYVVVMPDHDLDLALFTSANAAYAVDDLLRERPSLVDPAAPRAAVGHSLGGVVSAQLWAADARWTTLVLLASYPAGGTPVEDRAGPVLSIRGAEDGLATAADVEAGFARFNDPRWLATVDGMTHFDWTDDATDDEKARDGTSTRPTDESRADAARVIDTLLDATLRGGDLSAMDAAFPGVEVQ
jgi:predicted dienelactone hydrolase